MLDYSYSHFYILATIAPLQKINHVVLRSRSSWISPFIFPPSEVTLHCRSNERPIIIIIILIIMDYSPILPPPLVLLLVLLLLLLGRCTLSLQQTMMDPNDPNAPWKVIRLVTHHHHHHHHHLIHHHRP